MRNTISKVITAGVAALALSASLVATTEPAAAQWRHGYGGWHGGYGGWHGGGYGWHGGGVWHPGYWRGGYWYNGWWGPAAVAGALAAGALTAGAIAASPYGYGYGYGAPYGCIQNRPLYAPNGAWIGNGPVNVCQ
jgi:hypothetical protein